MQNSVKYNQNISKNHGLTCSRFTIFKKKAMYNFKFSGRITNTHTHIYIGFMEYLLYILHDSSFVLEDIEIKYNKIALKHLSVI